MLRERVGFENEIDRLIGGGASREREVIPPSNDITRVAKTTIVPHRWICEIAITYVGHGPKFEETTARGTGTLVGTRWLLTSAHVFVPMKGEAPYDVRAKITPAWDGKTAPWGSAKMKRWFIPAEYEKKPSASYDYALIELDRDLSSKKHTKHGVLGYWGKTKVARLARHDPASLVGVDARVAGYPGTKGGMQESSGTLDYTKHLPRLLSHTADTQEGHSGAPVWIEREKVCDLVGVHQGPGAKTQDAEGNWQWSSNYSVRITRELLRQLSAWGLPGVVIT